MKVVAIIPARYASTRFPAKPLAMLGGKMIVQRVYEQVSKVVERVVVATDDERIYNAVISFGGEAVMTSSEHNCGTDRCNEACDKIGFDKGIVINVQGDEPFVQREHIELLIRGFESEKTDIMTLATPFSQCDKMETLENPNSPKVVVSKHGYALYFSREVIPHLRGVERSEWIQHHTFYKHMGLYAFRREILREVTALEPTPLERAEKLEQLRWLENGYSIGVGITATATIGIDTPEDLIRAEEYMKIHQF